MNTARLDGIHLTKDEGETYVYDADGNLVSAKEAAGKEQFRSDGNGNLKQFTSITGTSFTYGYDGNNNLTWARNSSGQSYQFTYDAYGNPTSSTITGKASGLESGKVYRIYNKTYPLLKECEDINFTGSIEAREIPHGGADVIVAEGFTGNVILKLYEGTASALVSQIKAGMLSSFRAKIGALLVKPALKKTLKSFDATEYGGAPMLGLKGLVVKTHGSAKAKEVKNTLIQCQIFN